MYTLAKLQKQQVGLRLHTYLVEEIDELTKLFSLNRTDIIEEAVKSYISEQKAILFYEGFEKACEELQNIRESDKSIESLGTLEELIDELENS
jgi:CopG family transcriptional regulator/antitoxin EndoAI